MFATRADIEKAYGAELLLLIADRDNDGAVDDEAVTDALTQAGSVAESYIGARYTLPLPSVPEALKSAVVDLAVHRLAATADAATEQQAERRKNAISWLRDVQAGKANLGLDTNTGKSPRPIVQQGGERRFNRKTLRDL